MRTGSVTSHRRHRQPWQPTRGWIGGIAALGGFALSSITAQTPIRDPPPLVPAITSLGQPPRWEPYLLGFFGTERDETRGRHLGIGAGVHRALGSQITGVLGVSGEPFVVIGDNVRAGARGLLASRALSLGLGAEYAGGDRHVEPLIMWNTAVRRGGLLGSGSMIRLDWYPFSDQRVDVGVSVPTRGRPGRTRPHQTGVSLPSPRSRADPPALISVEVDSALALARVHAHRMVLYEQLYPDVGGGSLRASLRRFRERTRAARDKLEADRLARPDGMTAERNEAAFHAHLRDAYALLVGDELADEVAAAARQTALDEVILPYDALFGRPKEGNTSLDGLRARAHARFGKWLIASGVSANVRLPVQGVFERQTAMVEDVYRQLVRSHDDSRVAWLPPQLALLPEEHDEQWEIDSLVSRATARAFTALNRITYVRNTELQQEFRRSIRLARDYHVLWLHDYTGRNENHDDEVGYSLTVDGYLEALVRAVRAFDTTRRLPVFMLFVDQYFYDLRDGRLWLTILEDPLGASTRRIASDTLRAGLERKLAELREAVRASPALQAEAVRRGRSNWLRRTTKVHVNVTWPADFSFRSHRVVPKVPFVPDNIMRDHRKIAFYDLREDDPYRGELLVAGAGVGEHYASATWDDRALLIRGPAAIEAKSEIREALRQNGIAERDIPYPLGASAGTTAQTRLDGDLRNVAEVLQVHNEVGFGSKRASVARAMLYSLMPPGSVIIVPDAMWLSTEWASLVASAALRGAEVFVIAPSVLNEPSAGLPQLATTHELLARFLILAQELGPVMRESGGDIHVGLFTAKEDVNDVRSQIAEVSAGMRRSDMAVHVFPYPKPLRAMIDSLPHMLELPPYAPLSIAEDARLRLPQLHQKTQFLATRATIDRLVARPEWRDLLLAVFTVRIQQASAFRDTLGAEVAARAYMRVGLDMIDRYRASLPKPHHDILYLTIGSQNQDARGMVLDGEASVVVSGAGAVISMPDFFYLLARSTWITRIDQLDRFIPPTTNLWRKVARFVRYAL